MPDAMLEIASAPERNQRMALYNSYVSNVLHAGGKHDTR